MAPPAAPTVTDALLAPLRAGDAARPVVTFYDRATGERVELSGLTFENWVAKTANLLRDECDVEQGATVALLLPAHWQTAAVLLGAWWCGARVTAEPAGADVALADAASLPLAAGAGLVLGLSLDAFGRPLADLPAGALDYASEVRVHGDHFTPDPVDPTADAFPGVSVDALVEGVRARADELGLTASDRVLSTLDWPVAASGGLVDGLLAVLATGASLVQVRHPGDAGDEAALERTASTERCTRRLT